MVAHYRLARGYVSEEDFDLVRVCDDPNQCGGNRTAMVHQAGSRRQESPQPQ